MPLAGVWESWVSPEGEVVESFALLTREAEGSLRDLHDRMPLPLRNDDIDAWLSPAPRRRDAATPEPSGVEALQIHRVSRLVSSPKNDAPECMAPADGAAEDAADRAASPAKSSQLDLFLQANPRRR